MFLKIATVLAILGLLLSLLLAVIQQAFLLGGYYGSSMQLIYRLTTLGAAVSFSVPLIIFLVAFLFSLNAKKS